MTFVVRGPGGIRPPGIGSPNWSSTQRRPLKASGELNAEILPVGPEGSPFAAPAHARPDTATSSEPTVLLVAPLPPPPFKGGVEKGVDLLLRTPLARRSAMRLFNTYHHPDPGRPRLAKLRFQAGMVRSLWSELSGQRLDLVHVKTSSGINFHQNALYCLEARLRSLPVLLQIHSGRFEAFYHASVAPVRAWIRHTLSRVDGVVVLSQYWRERIRKIAPAARIHVVPNGLSEEELAELRVTPIHRPPQVFFLGTGRASLNRDKGLDDILAVLPGLARRHPQVRWIIAGLEDPQATARALTGQWQSPSSIGTAVRCLGTIDARRKSTLLKESTILAMPSYFENMPNLLLEGMAAGMGVVATGVGAIPEMLDSDRGGLLVDPGDRSGLDRALDQLLSNPLLVRRQGGHNQRRVRREYSMSVVESRFGDLYREVVRSRRWAPVLAPTADPDAEEAIDMPVSLPPVIGGDVPIWSLPVGGATRVFAREALRMSAGLFGPAREIREDLSGSLGGAPLLPESRLPDSV